MYHKYIHIELTSSQIVAYLIYCVELPQISNTGKAFRAKTGCTKIGSKQSHVGDFFSLNDAVQAAGDLESSNRE